MRNTIEKYVRGNKIVSLGLENNHKYKLYEMCNNIIDNNNPNINISIYKDIIRIPKQGTQEIAYDCIHWFELCTTHLCFHICSDPLDYIKYTIDYSMAPNKEDMKHPIDYLYDDYDVIKDLFKNVFNYKDVKSQTNNKDLLTDNRSR